MELTASLVSQAPDEGGAPGSPNRLSEFTHGETCSSRFIPATLTLSSLPFGTLGTRSVRSIIVRMVACVLVSSGYGHDVTCAGE